MCFSIEMQHRNFSRFWLICQSCWKGLSLILLDYFFTSQSVICTCFNIWTTLFCNKYSINIWVRDLLSRWHWWWCNYLVVQDKIIGLNFRISQRTLNNAGLLLFGLIIQNFREFEVNCLREYSAVTLLLIIRVQLYNYIIIFHTWIMVSFSESSNEV